MKKKLSLLFVVFFISLSNIAIQAQETVNKKNEVKLFRHGSDNQFDVSNFLNSTVGFLPVPILITEPAVGYGGGAFLAYFHKKKQGDKRPKGLSPTITFGGGAYTENGTWGAILGHQGSYNKDMIRYLGVVGYISPNLTLYGGNFAGIDLGQFKFNINGFVTLQEVLFRLKKDTPFFLGGNYTYFNDNVTFHTGITEIPGWDKIVKENNLAGVNMMALWDNRNNSFTPTKGIMSSLEFGRFAKIFGGDTNFWNLESRSYFYKPVIEGKLFSGYRLHILSKTGEVPFYSLPYVSLRGIPALRYQANNVITIETEWRWNFYKRWSAVGFVGAGNPMKDISEIGKKIKSSGGVGFRYLIAKDYGMHGGIDIARGPEQWAWQITVGSHWGR